MEQPGHRLLHAGVRAGENVGVSVTVDVHKLWSRAGASPNTRHFGRFPFGQQPGPGCEFLPSQVLEDADLSLVELPDEELMFAVPLEIGPTRSRKPRAFGADGGIPRLETYRLLEFGGAREGSTIHEHECR